MAEQTLASLPRRAGGDFGTRIAFHFPRSPGLAQIDYEQLDRWSAALRDRLRGDVDPGDFVVLSGQNSIEWVIALFGIIRAGAVPVPLDPDIADEQLEPMLSELEPGGVLADEQLLERFQRGRPAGGLRMALEQVSAGGAPSPADQGDHEPEADDLAILVYTAGTTGLPKGVRLTHRNLLANIEGVIDAVGPRASDSVMVVLPLYHAFSLMVGCLAPVAAGVRVELESRPLRLASRMRDDRPTLLIGVPALFETMLKQIRRGSRRGWRRWAFLAAFGANRLLVRGTGVNAGRLLFRPLHRALGGRLRFAVSGASALRRDTAEDAFLIGLPLMQGYGLSEAGPVISVQRFDPRRFWLTRHYWKRIGSVGTPLRRVSVVAEPVAGAGPQEVGELVVRGPSVMAGYYRRDEETRGSLRDGRLYTGDLGRIDKDGAIWITGRAKLAASTPEGELVQLERVESALADLPEAEQVIVRVEQDPRWQLTALVYPAAVAADGGSAEALQERVEAAIGRRAAERLRPFERPGRVRLLDEPVPQTALGKVRRETVPGEVRFDIDRWRERTGAPGGPTDEEREAIARRIGDERYRLPLARMVPRVAASLVLGRHRELALDGRRLLSAHRTRVEAANHIPRDRPFIVVMNHYERDGLRVWWPAMLVSGAIHEVRQEWPAIRWLINDRFFGVRIAGLPIPVPLVSKALRSVGSVYGAIMVGRAARMTSTRSSAVLAARASLRGEDRDPRPVGVTPEAARGFGPALVVPPSNAGMSIALLSDGEIEVLPVAVFEDEGVLVARFGEPYMMDWPGREEARARRDELTGRVMRSLAELLPPELRGAYR